MKCAKGEYQRSLILGYHNWSGSSLSWSLQQGYGRSYAESRRNLKARMEKAGLSVTVVEGILVISSGKEWIGIPY